MAAGDTRKVLLENTDGEYLIPYTEVASSNTVGRVKPDGTSTSVDTNGVISVIGKQDTISDLATIRSGAAAGATAAQPSDIGNAEIEIQKNGTKVDSFTTNQSGSKKTINITVPTSAADISALPSSTKYGASITVSLKTTDYKLTITLKDQDGNTLGTAQVVDFPIESVVVNGSYDSTNKKIVLTLQNGNTVDIPVADLISGLQSEITSSNKLDADLIDDSTSTNKFVTASDKTTWNGKQNALTFDTTPTSSSTNPVTSGGIYTALGDKADDSAVVKLTGDQTIAGQKTFSDKTTLRCIKFMNGASANNGGYIDFHYNNNSGDYTSRIIENSSGNIRLQSTSATAPTPTEDTASSTQIDTVGARNTKLQGYADTSLSNLSSAGQLILDTQNGTISNCIVEIPQNIKVTLENNVLTLKAGSVVTLTGSTYSTYTLTSAQSYTIPNTLTEGKYYLFTNSSGVIQVPIAFADVASGSSLPASGTYFFLTSDKLIYSYNSSWSATNLAYPFAIIDVKSGVATFAKDSNGNDMIFNGTGFVGHHAFVLPNTVSLIPNGFNADGSLKSIELKLNYFMIRELTAGSNPGKCITTDGMDRWNGYLEVNTYDDFISQKATAPANTRFYVKSLNKIFVDAGGSVGIIEQTREPLAFYSMTDTTVTDFTIRQPVRTATTEMLDKKQDILVSGTNIKTINGSSVLGSGDITVTATVAWGGITGTLSNQTDLQNALSAKADDSAVVKLTGNQTIAGTKTFSSEIKGTFKAYQVHNNETGQLYRKMAEIVLTGQYQSAVVPFFYFKDAIGTTEVGYQGKISLRVDGTAGTFSTNSSGVVLSEYPNWINNGNVLFYILYKNNAPESGKVTCEFWSYVKGSWDGFKIIPTSFHGQEQSSWTWYDNPTGVSTLPDGYSQIAQKYGNMYTVTPTDDNTTSNQIDTVGARNTKLATKQDTLVSGTNIKTINGSSVLGSGDLTVSATASWGGITGTLSNQTDLQNALNAKANTSDLDVVYVVVETWSSGTSWYRVWSDGWIEQGGETSNFSGSDSTVTVTLNKTFTTTNYTVSAIVETHGYKPTLSYGDITTSSFSLRREGNSDIGAGPAKWYACGY